MIRKRHTFKSSTLSETLWLHRCNRIGQFDPIPSRREAEMAFIKRIDRNNKHTMGAD